VVAPPPLPSLADWMRHGLYDAEAGYYAAGRVRFGHGEDFWTFPTRLSPAFGQLLAEYLAGLRARLVAAGDLDAAAPFVVVELGAGDGTLARDVLDAAAAFASADVGADAADALRGLAATLCYRIGERSAALRRRQHDALGPHADAALPGSDVRRVAHLPQRDDDLLPTVAPFAGVVLHNELLDVWPHELLRPAARRRLVLDVGGAFDRDGLVHAMRAAYVAGAAAPPLAVSAAWAPIERDDAWLGADTDAWLDALAPWLAHLRAHGVAEPSMLVCPQLGELTRWAAATLRAGWMLTIDYGAGCDHQLDPQPALPQLRLYPQPAAVDERPGSLQTLLDLDWPGRQDVTVDIDFSHLAWCGAEVGLAPVVHGPQGLLAAAGPLAAALADGGVATVTLDVQRADVRAAVEARLRARQGLGAVEAAQLAYGAARSFVHGSAGFRLLLQERTGTRGSLAAMAPGWQVLPAELPALARALSDGEREAFGLPETLSPTRSLLAALDEAGLRGSIDATLAALEGAGLLARPGAARQRAAR
jgi:SAM-dependent MidA family methyltransferase